MERKKNQGETGIPESHAHFTYTRQTTSHVRNRLNLHPRKTLSGYRIHPGRVPWSFAIHSLDLLPLGYNTFIFPGPDVLQGSFEVALRAFEAGVWFILVGLKVGMNELNQPIEILGGDGFVLLVEVVDVTVQNLDEKLHGNGSVHAGVSNTKGTLEAFENPFSIAVEL